MEAFREIGFNRTSFGVQDFNPQVQEAINRVQSEEITRQTVQWARELGFQSINLDLIYGLPFQTLETFAETVGKIIDISPNRVAVFNYAHVPWLKKHQNVMPAEAIPSPDERLNILQMTIEKLIGAGYDLHRHGPFRQTDRRARHRPEKRHSVSEFPGLLDESGLRRVRVWNVGDQPVREHLRTEHQDRP